MRREMRLGLNDSPLSLNDLLTQVKYKMRKRSQRARKTDPMLSFHKSKAMCNNSTILFHKYMNHFYFLCCWLWEISIYYIWEQTNTQWIHCFLYNVYWRFTENFVALTSDCFINLLYIKAMFIQCTITFESFLSCGHRQRQSCEKTALCMTGLEMRDKVKRERDRTRSKHTRASLAMYYGLHSPLENVGLPWKRLLNEAAMNLSVTPRFSIAEKKSWHYLFWKYTRLWAASKI